MLSIIAVLGLAAGLARPRFSFAPVVMSWALVAGYAILLITAGAWVAACPGCTSLRSYDSTRVIDLMIAFYWGGLFLACELAIVWLGAGIAALVGRRRTRA